MLTKVPAGEPVRKVKVEGATFEDVIPKKKGVFTIKVTGHGSGWAIFEGNKRVIAAFYDKNTKQLFGEAALSEIMAEFRRGCTVEVETLPKRVAELYVKLNPSVAILKDLKSAVTESRIMDELERVTVTNVDQFTEEWEEGKVEDTEISTTETDETEEWREVAIPEQKESKEQRVENLYDFALSLKDFRGKIVAHGDIEDYELYVDRGKIVGAIVRSGDIEMKGLSAIYFLETPAVAKLEEGDFEVPEEARCEENSIAVRAFYSEVDKA